MSIKKRIIYFFAAGIFLLVLFIPAIVSSSWMKAVILSSINQDINGALEIKSLHLSWLGPQKIQGVKLKTQRDIPVVSANHIEIDRSLFAFLFSRSDIPNIKIDDLNVEIGDPLIKTLGAKYFPLRLKKSGPIKLIRTNLFLRKTQNDLKIIVSGSTEQNQKTGSIQLDANFTKDESLISATIANFPVEVLDLFASLSNPNLYGIFQQLFGDTVNIIVKDVIQPQKSNIQFHLASKQINFSVDGVVKDNRFQLTTPATGSLVLDPAALKDLLSAADQQSSLRLAAPLKVNVAIHDAEIPVELFKGVLTSSESQDMAINLTLKVPQLEWELDQQRNRLKNLDLQVAALAGHPSFELNFNGEVDQGGKSFPFQLKSFYRKPGNLEDLIVSLVQPQKMLFSLNQLQTKNLDHFFGTGDHWQAIFGKAISLHLLSDSKDLNTIDITLNSDRIDIPNLRFQMDQTVLLGRDLRSKPISGVLSANQIHFKKENSSLKDYTVNWKVNLLNHTFAADFSGNTQFNDSRANGALKGSIYGDFREAENPTIHFAISGNRVPAPFVSLITGRKEWGPVFGPSIDFSVDARLKELNGPIKAEVSGPSGKLKFHGTLSGDILTLNSPLHISTLASPALGRDVFSDFAPVFGQLISSNRSISLDIEPEAFSMPLSFNYSQMNFKLATLNLGRMTFHNKGDVNRLLNVLKAGNPSQVEVWATPLYFSMDRGQLTIYRMDMLVLNQYPIATWGNIDLVKDKVNMVLGLSSAALAQSLGITGLPKEYMLQIPVTGSTSSTKINSTMVMSRIGALIAQSTGGPQGLVLGTVWDIANGREPKVPKPTTQPFPWGDLTVENDKQNNKPLQSYPIDGIQKEAKKLIKGIFR